MLLRLISRAKAEGRRREETRRKKLVKRDEPAVIKVEQATTSMSMTEPIAERFLSLQMVKKPRVYGKDHDL